MSLETSEQVNSILQKIMKENNEAKVVEDKSNSRAKNKNPNTVRGIPKSGKFWKTKKDRFSTIVKTKGIRPDFKKKTELRHELNRTKALSKQLIEQINEKQLTRKERRRENLKRAEENKKKSEIVQVITNSAKLKRMKKKQLRFIEKRDVNKETINLISCISIWAASGRAGATRGKPRRLIRTQYSKLRQHLHV